MATIAQLTDLHLIEGNHEARPLGARARLSLVSFGRPLDAAERRRRAASALADVRAKSVDHLLITGDLTEEPPVRKRVSRPRTSPPRARPGRPRLHW
jgi:3',5'-cyclic AMP phosphodiesterase CpdA